MGQVKHLDRAEVYYQPALEDDWSRIRILYPNGRAEYLTLRYALFEGYRPDFEGYVACYSDETYSLAEVRKAMRAYDRSLGYPTAIKLGVL